MPRLPSIPALLLAACAWLPSPAAGQARGEEGEVLRLTQYVLDAWGTEEGLPQNTVNAVAQTSEGYLWLGTEEGLARYNGTAFTVFDEYTTPAFGGAGSVQVLHADTEGRLWAGTRGGGLLRYENNGRFTHFGPDEGLEGADVSALHEDARGVLWVGTYDAGLFYRQGERFVRLDAELGTPLVTAVHRDRAGRLWVGTDAGLHRIDGKGLSTFDRGDGLPDDFILHLHEDKRGDLWVSTRGGLRRLREGRTVVPDEAAPWTSLAAFDLLEDADGTLWLATDGGGLVRLRGGTAETLTTADGLAHDRVLTLFRDREGSLWAGTEGGGLNRLRAGKFVTYSTREGLAADMVTTVAEDAGGHLWVGTEGYGVSRIDPNGRIQTLTTADGLSSDVVLSLAPGDDGDVWIGTYGGGLERWREERVTSFTAADGLPSNAVFVLHRRPGGPLWIGTDAGLARYDGDGFTTFTTADGLPSDFITAVLEGADGTVWVGTYDAGLARLQDGRAVPLPPETLPHPTVSALHEDADGTLWVGTYGGGLVRLRGGAATTYRAEDGLLSENIYQILEDAAGYLWMSSSRGIFRVRRAELDAFARGGAERIHPDGFDLADGLPTTEMNGGVQPAGWRSRDGRLWFPTARGLTGIDPVRFRRNDVPPTVVLERVEVDRLPTDPRAGLAIPPGHHKIEFHYAALTYIAPDRVTYEYLLEGYDTEWNEAGASRTAVYTNLDAGTYTFRIRARHADGLRSTSTAAFTFRQEAHFYERPGFAALVVLMTLLLGLAAYRARVHHLTRRQETLQALVSARTSELQAAKDQIEAQADQLRELDRFKTRFFANISHEFRTPLTLMIGPLENALAGTFGMIASPLNDQLSIMLRNAMRLLRLINQLLDLSKLESGKMELRARQSDLVPFLEGITFAFTAFAQQKKIDLHFEPQAASVPLYFEPDKLEKVFFNLLSNAVKFTPSGGTIRVGLTVQPPSEEASDGAVEVRVEDDGPGIPAEALPYVFDRFRQVDDSNTREHEGTGIGLALVKELVLLHGGQVHVESKAGAGAVFTVRLLQGRSHLGTDAIETNQEAGDALPEAASARGGMIEMASSDFNRLERADRAAPESADDVSLRAPLILVVDDNADILDYVRSCLHPHYRIAVARDGLEGLEQVVALEPDLVISDVMMPRMDGNAFCRALKGDRRLSHIPVILLSAKTSQEAIVTGLEHGADEYLPKPFNARELHARIRNLLTLRAQERALKELNESLEARVQEQLKVILSERNTYEDRLIAEKERAEEASRLKSAILSNMSHEFRTPMTAILGYTEILASEVEEPHREFTTYIHRNAQRLMSTLDAVLDMARLEANLLTLDAVPVNLSEAAGEVVQRFQPGADRKGLTLRMEAPDEPVWVRADRSGLQRIVGILVDNAVKFTAVGEVALSVRATEAGACLAVRDTGVGIAAPYHAQLFSAFEQESMGDARSFEGNGLSLGIVRRLLDLMGGAIEVESEKGRGSTFIVHLPAAHTDSDDAASPTATAARR